MKKFFLLIFQKIFQKIFPNEKRSVKSTDLLFFEFKSRETSSSDDCQSLMALNTTAASVTDTALKDDYKVALWRANGRHSSPWHKETIFSAARIVLHEKFFCNRYLKNFFWIFISTKLSYKKIFPNKKISHRFLDERSEQKKRSKFIRNPNSFCNCRCCFLQSKYF